MNKTVLTVGFAVFTMFFGAGNMVLPLYLMQKWPNHWFPAFVGFCVTGVFVTLLGLIAAVLAKGNVKTFFAPLGLTIGLILQIILIAIEGPFGIIPRSFIIAYGAVKTLWPVDHHLFYFVSCATVYCLAINKSRIIKVIGNILTPAMLMFLFLIVIYSLLTLDVANLNFNINHSESFIDGLTEGYLTYDLPGAIYFTSIAMFYLTSLSSNEDEVLSNGIKSSLLSAGLLIFVYSLFIYLGLSHSALLENTPPEQIIPKIVTGSLGPIASVIFGIFIYLACITTAIAATTIWTDFIHHYIPKLNKKFILFVTLTIAFFMSSLDFTDLMQLLGPILNLIYPILIGLTIYNILIPLMKRNKNL